MYLSIYINTCLCLLYDRTSLSYCHLFLLTFLPTFDDYGDNDNDNNGGDIVVVHDDDETYLDRLQKIDKLSITDR
jgi:hypothetical protein